MSPTIEQIAKAGANWSIEVTPAGAGKVESFGDALAPGTDVNVTFLPGSDPSDTAKVAARLRDEGMHPIPHIAARSIHDKAQLESILKALKSEASVDEVLIIGGGVDNPVGDFASSMDILETGLIQDHGIGKIGVSGHPEGSPDIPADALASALAWKNEFARKEGLNLYIETQFCFEAEQVLAWERDIRAAGNALPIRIGIPGPATIKTLFRFAQISGIGPSMRFISKQAKNVAKLLTVQAPDLLLADLAQGMAEDKDCLLAHFHYYPFGGFAKTAAYASSIAAGDITLKPKGGFSVVDAS